MSTPKVPRGTVVPLRPKARPEPLTLADITITWTSGNTKREVTGRQIARLLTTAAEEAPSGLFACGPDVGYAVPMLRGLADLVFPDPRDGDHLKDDTRFFICESMEALAAKIAGTALDSDGWPAHFVVNVRKGAGNRETARRPTARAAR